MIVISFGNFAIAFVDSTGKGASLDLYLCLYQYLCLPTTRLPTHTKSVPESLSSLYLGMGIPEAFVATSCAPCLHHAGKPPLNAHQGMRTAAQGS